MLVKPTALCGFAERWKEYILICSLVNQNPVLQDIVLPNVFLFITYRFVKNNIHTKRTNVTFTSKYFQKYTILHYAKPSLIAHQLTNENRCTFHMQDIPDFTRCQSYVRQLLVTFSQCFYFKSGRSTPYLLLIRYEINGIETNLQKPALVPENVVLAKLV